MAVLIAAIGCCSVANYKSNYAFRHILRLAKYDYGPVKQPNFFQVPADSGGHGSFWSSRSGNCSRGAAWFQSRAYDTCYAELFYLERNISLLSASPVGEARLPMPKGMAYKD
jgi:hypothetical protein